eukprot:gene619-10313_t
MESLSESDKNRGHSEAAFEKIRAFLAEREKGMKNIKKYMSERLYNVPYEDDEFYDDSDESYSFESLDINPFVRLQNLMGYRQNPLPFAILSREDVVNDFAIPAKYSTQGCNFGDESEYSFLDVIPDGVIIKILGFLSLKNLLAASRTCQRWRQLAFDMSLWARVDMQPYRKTVSESTLVRIIRNLFSGKIRELSLKGFKITQTILQELAKCSTLKSLNLDGCKFVGKFKSIPTDKPFPTGLQELSLASVTGESAVLKLIVPALLTVKKFKITNHFSDQLFDLDEMLQFLPELRVFFVNNGLQLTGDHIKAIARQSKSLQSLAIMHALEWEGDGLDTLIKECTDLEELHFKMNGVTDHNLGQVDWETSKLTKVVLSLCRNISSAGMKNMLSKLKYLERLELSSGSDGFAIDDSLLLTLAMSDLSYLKHLRLE